MMLIAALKQHKGTILYGLSLALLLFLLKFLHIRYILIDHAFEIYVGFIAVIFMSLGVWLAMRLRNVKTETIVIETNVKGDFIFNTAEASRRGLSRRELEVLELMAGGFSNQEIGDQLFVSLNTVKTHSRRIFEKMEVVRRSQAVDKARKLMLIP